jgi:hypothetical protein
VSLYNTDFTLPFLCVFFNVYTHFYLNMDTTVFLASYTSTADIISFGFRQRFSTINHQRNVNCTLFRLIFYVLNVLNYVEKTKYCLNQHNYVEFLPKKTLPSTTRGRKKTFYQTKGGGA